MCMNAFAYRILAISDAGYYSGFPYAMAQLGVEVPYLIAQSILFSLLVRHLLPMSSKASASVRTTCMYMRVGCAQPSTHAAPYLC
jgi:hypothetical protein